MQESSPSAPDSPPRVKLLALRPDRETPAALYAYRSLREMIVSLDLKPGSPAGEQAMADLLGVSRTPIREALSLLSSEGLIDIYSRRGVVVAPIRIAAVETAQFVRETLEAAIIREAASDPEPRQLFAVGQAIDEQAYAVEQGETGMFFEADEKMHAIFARIARRDLAWPLIVDAKKHMDRLRRLSIRTIDLRTLLDDHRALQSALLSRDPDSAETTMRQHLQRALTSLPELMERFPDYFEVPETAHPAARQDREGRAER